MRVKKDVALEHNGQKLKGRISSLNKSEIRIVMTSPVSGISASQHHFFKLIGEGYEFNGNLTVEGKKVAGTLLSRIYNSAMYFEQNLPELKRQYQSIEDRIKSAYELFRNTMPKYAGGDNENIVEHQGALQNILWLNHEFYKIVQENHPELEKMGMDTFIDLVEHYLKN